MSNNKKVIAISALSIALVAIPVLLFLYSRSSFNPSSVEIDGQKVSKEELEKVASEQYDPASVDNEILAQTVDTVVERKILDKLAAQNNLTASQEEIQKVLDEGTATSQEAAKYVVLEEKVTKAMVKNWELFSIRFWIPADKPVKEGDKVVYKAPTDLTSEESVQRLRQLEDTPKFLADAETMLKTNTALVVAQDLAKKYPSLSQIIAVNNNFVTDYIAGSPYASDFTNPEIITGDELQDDLYASTIQSMTTPGEIKKIQSEHNGGGAVFMLVSYHNAPYTTYQELLREETKKITNQ